MTLPRLLISVSVIALLSGCANLPISPSSKSDATINAGYKAGDVDMGPQAAPSLDDLVNAKPSAQDTLPDSDDKLRAPAMRDAALAFGAQGGLASTSVDINAKLKASARELSQTYDFGRLVIKGPDGAMVLPPVISEARDTWESQDGGKSLRIADKYYEIIAQSRFTPVAPLWHSYLIRQFALPATPPDAVLPKNDGERKYWATFVRLGWDMGARQAREIFDADLRRLERDFTGMVRYRQLLDEGKVSAPVIADSALGVTGNDNAMRVNDRAVRITQDPKLQLKTTNWQASPSLVTKEEAATPPGKTFIAPAAVQDAPDAVPSPVTPVNRKVVYDAPRTRAPRYVPKAAIEPEAAPLTEPATPSAAIEPQPATSTADRYF